MKIPVYDIWEGSTMEESSPSQNHNGQLGSSAGGINAVNKPNDESNQRLQYSIPGILHFIQHEWARFEVERSQWEVDRAELQARIAFLQGERNGQENLKNDLVRRIKMLEYALKQERAKFHKLKYGTELNQGGGDLLKPPGAGDEGVAAEVAVDVEAPFTSVSNISWKQGRQLLRQYLQEIGYTDTIIDVRSNRVRSLLGLNNNEETVSERVGGGGGTAPFNTAKRAIDNQGRTTAKKVQCGPGSALAEAMILETEAAVMANFDFLSQADVEMDDDDDGDGSHDGSGSGSDDPDGDDIDERDEMRLKRTNVGGVRPKIEPDDVDADAEEFLNELNLLSDVPVVYPGAEVARRGGVGEEEEAIGIISDGALGLGELARLTVNNEAEAAYDLPSTKESLRKTWNAKYTLRSHFDGVRALAFHPVEPVLITASEDHTLKLWNLQKTVPAKKSASLDVEPLYTFRCHTGPVLCLAMSAAGDRCFSGATDANIHCWNLPSANIDPYDSFEPSVLHSSLVGHTDAVWGLAVHSPRGQLLSCSADGTVKLWTPHNARLCASFVSEPDGVPTSMDFVRDEADKMVAAYNSGDCVLFDLETTKSILRLETSQESGGGSGGKQINRVVCHPTLPLTVTAHEDRHIRFLDNNTGKTVHSMVAHLDAVTSLAVDPNGLYLLSGSHDCSIRLWNLDNKTCVQEITAHRKKFDESILDVAFHPSRPYIASAGADALAKVFV